MNDKEEKRLLSLVKKEADWAIISVKPKKRNDPKWAITVPGIERIFPLAHPFRIHLWIYRHGKDAEVRYRHMKAAHDILWPQFMDTWNAWDEIKFRAHVGGYQSIVYAGGAGCSKSHTAARIAILFYLAGPRDRAVIVSSTTMDSLESRVWGYIQEFLNESRITLSVKVLESKPPKVLPTRRSGKMYGMFAVAIKQGEDAKVINTLIGRHPKGGLMFLLDESPDMDPAVIQSVANLSKSVEIFQLMALGNSKSRNDLHGALATPRAGWNSVNPLRDDMWETSHERGICLYFNPYKSPAITEENPTKRLALAKFLPTKESIEKDERVYGIHSENFYRMCLGFWKTQDLDKVAASAAFLGEHQVGGYAEWSGHYPVEMVAGFDAAYRFGGTGAVLRFGYYGHTVSRSMCLDYRGEELIYRLEVVPNIAVSAELQIARQIIALLGKYRMPLYQVAFDVTGSGKVMGELVRSEMRTAHQPIKISFTGLSKRIQPMKEDPNVLTGRPDSFWFRFREFVGSNQIKGLDKAAGDQFCSRLVLEDAKRPGNMRLETKEEFRNRMAAINPKLAHSPDEADAAVLCLFAAIRAFGFRVGLERDVPGTGVELWKAKMYQRDVERLAQGRPSGKQFGVSASFSCGVEDLVGVKRRTH